MKDLMFKDRNVSMINRSKLRIGAKAFGSTAFTCGMDLMSCKSKFAKSAVAV